MKIRQAPSRPSFLPALSLLLALSIGSCTGESKYDRYSELRQNRRLWQSQGIQDYRFDQQKSCFCGPDYVQPTRVEVRGGEAVKVEVLPDGRKLPPHLSMTVEETFDRIEYAIEREYEHLEVTYDGELGYPTDVGMNPGGRVTDGGLTVVTSGLVRLDPLAACDPPPATVPCDCPAEYPAFAYRYTAWDDTGAPVAEGCMALTFTARPGPKGPVQDIAGARCIELRCTSSSSPHQGSSPVAGTLDPEGRFVLDLNAGWADNNIVLVGNGEDPNPGYLSGEWSHNTLVGPTAHGVFLLDRTSEAPGPPIR